MDKDISELAAELGGIVKASGMKIVTAESCTGGGISQALTEVPGSSAWFDRGFVTYSNNAKVQMLQVSQSTLDKYGAVSEEVAMEMASGAINNSEADLAVAVTGIAGPSGGSVEKPVGTVFICWQNNKNNSYCSKYLFLGTRFQICEKTIKHAIKYWLADKRI